MKIKQIITLTVLAIAFSNSIFSQVGIGTTTPQASAELDVTSTTKGLLPPRMTQTQRNNISSPAAGLMVYQSDGTSGLYYYNGSAWVYINNSTGGTLAVANGGTGVTTSTGTGSVVLSNSPTLVTPALGTPSALVGTNITGTAAGLNIGGNAATATTATTATSATSATTATNLAGGLGGQIPYQTAAGTTAMLANGTVGQVLQSNGTTLAPSWGTAGAGDMTLAGVQTVTGAKTFGAAGNVGKLVIAGSTSGTTTLNANATAGSGTVVLPTTGTLATLDGTETLTNKTLSSTVSITGSSALTVAAGGTNENITIYPSGTGNTILNGKVGIGTAYPNAPLQLGNSTGNRKFVLWEGVNNDHQFHGLGINSNLLRYQIPGTTDSHGFYAATSSTASNELMRIQGNGNVGIGTASPSTKLHVAGSFRLENGTQAAGRILTSDAAGVATWQTAAAALPAGTSGQTLRHDGTNWLANSNLFNNGTNVGIGTAAPNAPLQLGNSTGNRKFVLWEDANNDHQFYGLGINTATLRYQVSSTATDHVFYAGTSSTASNELMRIKGNGAVTINNNTVWHAGNDGTGSTLDADLLDGVQLAGITQSGVSPNGNLNDAFWTNAARLTSNYTTANAPNGNGWYYIYNNRHEGTSNAWGSQIALGMDVNPDKMYFRNHNNSSWQTWQQVASMPVGSTGWNSSNDGTGGGLDADLLDGVQLAGITQSGAGANGNLNDSYWLTASRLTSSSVTANAPYGNGWYTIYNSRHEGSDTTWGSQLAVGMTVNPDKMFFRSQYQSGWQTWQQLASMPVGSTGWHSSNDGTGSGLDADLLDGVQLAGITQSGVSANGNLNDTYWLTAARVTSCDVTANAPNGNGWYTIYNNRHYGGETTWGSQIAVGMTTNIDKMYFRNQYQGGWQAWQQVTSTAISDIRLKKNIKNLNYGLAEVMKLRPVSFYLKTDTANTEPKIGFIAQEVESLVPEAVEIWKDDMQTRHMLYAEMVPVLTKAIQEQQVIIESQKKEIETLKVQASNASQISAETTQKLTELESKMNAMLLMFNSKQEVTAKQK
jgi:hypothetical protein